MTVFCFILFSLQLLLHHVIPGAFRVNTLQDEMTGVSLAGTQLRVNTYTTHDIEWNDITVIEMKKKKEKKCTLRYYYSLTLS